MFVDADVGNSSHFPDQHSKTMLLTVKILLPQGGQKQTHTIISASHQPEELGFVSEK